MNRLSKLIVGVVIIGLTVSVLIASAIGATIADFPEANPFPAFKAGEEQRIWHRPGNAVLEAMAGPIVRFTATVYTGDQNGFVTLTHIGPDGKPVTFYYSTRVENDPRALLSLYTSGGMWEEGYLGLTPAVSAPDGENIFDSMPMGARFLWVMPPIQMYVAKTDDGYTLSLILGGPGLNGLVTLPLSGLQNFEDVQAGRPVKIWGATVLPPTSIKWAGENNDGKHGVFSWKPGDKEPDFQQDEYWM